MYEASPDLTCLRQGDVIRNFLFPRYKPSTASFLYSHSDNGDPEFQSKAILSNVVPRYAVILSQCCEFNEGKRNAFTLGVLSSVFEMFRPKLTSWGLNLAELVPVSKSAIRRGRDLLAVDLDSLRKSNKVDPNARQNESVNIYLYDKDGTHLQEPHLADFTQVISVAMEDKGRVLNSKILQLDSIQRRQFQVKLGYFYARKAE